MRVLVLPISGGAFPVQLGIITSICRKNYRPHIVLASSGGSVSSYVALAADWSPLGIRRIVSSMHEELFISSWTQGLLSFIPSYIIGYFKDSWYNSSQQGTHFFSQFFNSRTITQTEIWMGTVDCAHKKAQIFCNRARPQAIIKDNIDCKIYGVLPPIYLEGKVKDIASVCVASASIPTVVPPQIINERRYADGGVIHASPLSCMKDAIHNLEDVQGPGLHLTYINSFDMQQEDPVSSSYLTSVHNGKINMFDLVYNLSIQDRLCGIDVIRSPDLKMHFVEGVCEDGKEIQHIEDNRMKSRRTFVEYFPCVNDAIDLKSFDGKDVLALMDKIEKKYKYRVWWIGPHDIFSSLDKSNTHKEVHPPPDPPFLSDVTMLPSHASSTVSALSPRGRVGT